MKRKIGVGMKPRGPQPSEAVGEKHTANAGQPVSRNDILSAPAGQPEGAKDPLVEQEPLVESSDTLAPNSVQNLDSGKVASVASTEDPELADLLKQSGEDVVIGLTQGFTPESTVEEVFGGPVIVKAPTSIAQIEEAISKGDHPELQPNGEVIFHGTVGERPDGSFGLVVTIPEGMIDPIRQQAEADRLTPEEWVSQRLNEYLETWWSGPQSK